RGDGGGCRRRCRGGRGRRVAPRPTAGARPRCRPRPAPVLRAVVRRRPRRRLRSDAAMTRLPILLLIALSAGCATCPDIPDMPEAPQVVRVPVTEYVIPEWLVKQLPEDAPKANIVE